MARAETAGPSVARRVLFAGSGFRRKVGVSGHAKMLARPAYQQLLAAEPYLRRLIPILIVIFLVIVGLARFVELYQLKQERERSARATISMIAVALASSLGNRNEASEPMVRGRLLNALADALPSGATADGRRILVSNPDGLVIATAPRTVEDEDVPVTNILGETQPLTTFGDPSAGWKRTLPLMVAAVGFTHARPVRSVEPSGFVARTTFGR